jgi:hypothetical protein
MFPAFNELSDINIRYEPQEDEKKCIVGDIVFPRQVTKAKRHRRTTKRWNGEAIGHGHPTVHEIPSAPFRGMTLV